MKAILPVLLVLVCPLMMLFMRRGMRGGSHGTSKDHDHATSAHELDEGVGLEKRVHDLEIRLSSLEEEQYSDSSQTLTKA